MGGLWVWVNAYLIGYILDTMDLGKFLAPRHPISVVGCARFRDLLSLLCLYPHFFDHRSYALPAVQPSTGIVMVTMLEDDASIFSAMRAGARGYVLKGAQPDELLQTIRAVASGQVLFGPAIAARVMRFFNKQEYHFKASLPEEAFPELTPRELEVLELIAQGDRNKEIAEKLVISDKTVRNHITNIFSKLQVADRAQAIIKARDAGLADG